MKIAVYTIVKNEEQFIKRWAESCEEADIRVVVDTGSSDNTVKLAEDCGCTVYEIKVDPWRFDVARNMALGLIPEDVDYCISLDADEILLPNWKKCFKSLSKGVTRPRYKYVWSFNPDGSEGLVYNGDKIHSRHGYYWKHPVHEALYPSAEEIQEWFNLEIHHHPDSTKSRNQYLPLLELSVEEDPDNDRNQFYLAREYLFKKDSEKAIKHFLKHLELSKWNPERATSMRYLSQLTQERQYWLLRAVAEAPDRREPWIDLALYYYETANWPSCYAACKQALGIKEKPLEYLCEQASWGELPYDLCSIASWHLGLRNESLEHILQALKINPNDDRLKSNAVFIFKSTLDDTNKTFNDYKLVVKNNKFIFENIASYPGISAKQF